MIHGAITPAEAVDIDRASVGTLLQMLDARRDRLSIIAARIIRSQEATILSLDNEVVEAEWRAIAHAVEIDRMKDQHRANQSPSQTKRGKR